LVAIWFGMTAAHDSRMERDDLEARTAAFAVAIFELANAARDKPGGRRPADQLLDCATSIGANYRASARARSRDEFIAKLGIVNEEADEAVYWLQFFQSTKLADEAKVSSLLAESKELRSIFAASCRTAKRNHRGGNSGDKGRGRS
jgi:four helix bundle protein